MLDFILLLKGTRRLLRRLYHVLSVLLNLILQEGNFLLRFRQESLFSFSTGAILGLSGPVMPPMIVLIGCKGRVMLQDLMEHSAQVGLLPTNMVSRLS